MKRPVLLTCLAAGLLRVCSFPLSENAGGDALARAALAAQWVLHPGLRLHFHVWLPVHFWLIAATSLLVPNVEFAARMLSLILGIASVALVAWLAKELDGPKAACLSTIVFAGYSLHIGYSVTSSCDVPYLFFTLLGFALFFYSRNAQADWPLPFAGLFLTCAAGIRYEAWIIVFALDLILLYRRSWRGLALFAPLSASFPVFWMIYEWHTRGNPLYAPAHNHTWIAEGVHRTSLMYRVALPLAVVTITLTPLAVLGALTAVRQFWRDNRSPVAEFSAVALLFAGIELYQTATGGVLSLARYTLTLGTMVAVLAGIGLKRIELRPWALAAVMSANLIFLSILSFSHTALEDKARSVGPILLNRRYLNDAGVYLLRHTPAGDSVVFDNYNDEANVLASVAGFPLIPAEHEFIVPDSINNGERASTLVQLAGFVVSQRPVYVVYAPAGKISSLISFPAACSEVVIAGAAFDCVFSNNNYQIYRLKL
jgi:Dolichyl-phosphate-mannose-protein mannosyltransferase